MTFSVKMITFTILMSSLWAASLSQESMPNIQISLALSVNHGGGRFYKSLARSANPCQPNPCLYGGSCIPTDDQKDYQCTINCPYPMGGKYCSELACSPDCLRVGDTVYFVYATGEGRSQYESKLKCQERNMTLAMLKDKSVHHQIREKLAVMNLDSMAEKYCYWIGLKQTDGLSPWMWFDGTYLGTYDDWGNEPYGDYFCGQICHYRGYKFVRDTCRGTDISYGWTYFSFCEKSYPFLKD